MEKIKTKQVTPFRETRLPLKDRVYLVEILKGMGITLRHLAKNLLTYNFRKNNSTVVTIQYPEERREYSPRFRGRHRLKKNADGSLRCVACKLCAENCPSHCIFIEPATYPNPNKGNYPKRYEIDITRCIFCGFCVEACPKDAIELTRIYEMADTSRNIYDKEFLLKTSEESAS